MPGVPIFADTMEETSEFTEIPATTRDYHPADAAALACIYRAAILQTAGSVYSPAQCAAWADAANDTAAWEKRLQDAWVRVACTDDGEIVGFGGILLPGHIDLLFTAPEFNRQGVGSLILDDLLELGAAMGARQLTVDASELSRGFFEKHGFKLLGSGTHSRGEQTLSCHHLAYGK